MGKVIIQNHTTKNPITMIGEQAGICYGSDISDPKKNYKRGIECLENEHGRTFEFPDIYAIIDGYSARVIREWYTHIGGAPTRLQSSTRYIDYENYDVIVPPSVESKEKALELYNKTIEDNRKAYASLVNEFNIPKEDAANILNIGMYTKVADKRNLRNVMDMTAQRTCYRVYWEYRRMLMTDYLKALKEYSEEWKYLIENYFKTKCEKYGYCPEKNGCGRYPQKRRRDTDE